MADTNGEELQSRCGTIGIPLWKIAKQMSANQPFTLTADNIIENPGATEDEAFYTAYIAGLNDERACIWCQVRRVGDSTVYRGGSFLVRDKS